MDIDLPFTRIISKMEEFRNNNLFLDCCFRLPSGKTVKAHRIVLSKYSTVFKDFFLSKNFSPDKEEVDIPFYIDDTIFSDVIDFLYSRKIEMTEANMIPVWAMSYMYGIDTLKKITTEFIEENIKSADEIRILNYTKPFLSYCVDQSKAEIFPSLKENYEKLVEASDILAKVVAKLFSKIDTKDICNCITARMLAQVLAAITEDDSKKKIQEFQSMDDFKISIIDSYAKSREISLEDRKKLTAVINWDIQNSHLYFARHDCEWVSPEVARSKVSMILNNRRKSAVAVEEKINTLKDSCFHHFGVYQLFQLIVSSKGEKEISDCDLLKSLGTLWGSCKQFNPSLYRLVMPYKHMSLPMTKEFGIANMFENNSAYFFTSTRYQMKPVDQINKLTAGVDFTLGENSKVIPHVCVRSINVLYPSKNKSANEKVAVNEKTQFALDNTKFSIHCNKSSKKECKYENPVGINDSDVNNVVIEHTASGAKNVSIFSFRVKYIEIQGKFELH